MCISQGNNYSNIKTELDELFSVHPRENLHLASTLSLLRDLRELTDRLGSKIDTSDLVRVCGSEKFIGYYKDCLNYIASEPKLGSLANSQSTRIHNFAKLHGLLWHVCRQHCSVGYWLCEKLRIHGVHDCLWRFVSCRDLIATKCVQDSRTRLLVCWSFGILLHILTRTQVSVSSYRDCNGVHILRPFLMNLKMRKSRSQSEYLRMSALLLLSSLVNESENKSINASENYVVYLLSAVKDALEFQDLYSTTHKHHLQDLLRGLNRLTRFDANKRILLENQILEVILKILHIAKNLPNSTMSTILQSPVPNTTSDSLATEIIRLLWQLCFIPETREQLTHYPSLIPLCRGFGEAGHSTASRETVEGLMWSLSKPLTDFEMGGIKYAPLSSTGNPYGHIVFACNQTNYRKTVEFLKHSLIKRGYNVYLDQERMEMEKALKDASALIVCLSYSFTASPFCRQQVLSALCYGVALVPVLLESKYEPETWLHYLLATVIYTSFTENDDFKRAIESLSLALTKYGIVRETFYADNESESGYLYESLSSPSTALSRSLVLKNWSGQGIRSQLSELSNATTPTPSECTTLRSCRSCERPPFSIFSCFESGSHSSSQLSSTWSSGDKNSLNLYRKRFQRWPTVEEDQEMILAYQAPSEAVRSWNVERVQQWLEAGGLAHYIDTLDWLDGNLLWELAWHRIRSCETFFANLDHHLNMPQQDQILFSNNLSLLADAPL